MGMGIPPGTSTLINTPKGPSSLNPNRMVSPPSPAMLNPPSRPRKNILFATGVVVSKVPIMLSYASSFTMPPMSDAFISPPNIWPSRLTPMAAISMIGNDPSKRSMGAIFTPSMTPENSRPGIPSILSTLADRISTKSSG